MFLFSFWTLFSRLCRRARNSVLHNREPAEKAQPGGRTGRVHARRTARLSVHRVCLFVCVWQQSHCSRFNSNVLIKIRPRQLPNNRTSYFVASMNETAHQ